MAFVLFFFAVTFALVVYLITIYMRRVADLMLTDKFRAAESIANGRIPRQWVAQIGRHTARRWAPWIHSPTAAREVLALKKIDGLYRFFAGSPFVDSEKARQLLLARLQETRDAWSSMTWEEIIADYGGEPRADRGEE